MTNLVGYLHRYGVPSMPPYVTGDRVWRDLDELRMLCARRNITWGADDYWNWPVEVELGTKGQPLGEVRAHVEGVGLPMRMKNEALRLSGLACKAAQSRETGFAPTHVPVATRQLTSSVAGG